MKRFFFFCFFIFYTHAYCLAQDKNGNLDLRSWDFELQGNHALDAEWQFYYGDFLNSTQLDTVINPQYGTVPASSWEVYGWKGKAIPGTGIATYRLKVKLSRKYEILSLKIPDQSTAYRLFINKRLMAESGKTGLSREEMIPDPMPHIYTFSPDSDSLDIVIQLSNFYHRKGGLWSSILIGSEGNIQKAKENAIVMDIFLSGSLLLMSFYHFLLYFARKKKDLTILYFALLCLIVPARLISTGENYLMTLFPYISWAWKYKIEYMSLYFILIFISLVIYSLFPQEVSRRYTKVTFLISVAAILFILLTDPFYFTYTVFLVDFLAILSSITNLYWIFLAIQKKREGARLYLAGGTLLIITVMNDILHSLLIINTLFLIPFGFLSFFFAQSALIAIRLSKAFSRVEELSEELKQNNLGLEEKVNTRTQELQKTYNEIKKSQSDLQQSNQALETAYINLQSKNEDITASINYARRIQYALLPLEYKIKEVLPESFIYYLPKDIVSGDFYWFSSSPLNPDEVFFVVGDCTGHGVPGAFMTLIGNNLLSQIIKEKFIFEPAEILRELDRLLVQTLQQHLNEEIVNDGMDISLVRINKQKKEVVFAGAKRPMIHIRDGHQEEIKGSLFSIGGLLLKSKEFHQTYVKANENDIFYLFTDGFTDQFGGLRKRKFMISRFKELLNTIYPEPICKQKELLESAFQHWKGNENQLDDILVVGIRL